MNVIDKIKNLVDSYEKKFNNLDEQERLIFEKIKVLNTEIIKLDNQKFELYDGETIDVDSLSKISLKQQKINGQIKDKKEAVKVIREARESLEKKFESEIEPLQNDLRVHYYNNLLEVQRETQNIIDQAMEKMATMWDVGSDYDSVLGEIRKISSKPIDYSLPIVEFMNDTTFCSMRMIPIDLARMIKQNGGIEKYNLTHKKYGRFSHRD